MHIGKEDSRQYASDMLAVFLAYGSQDILKCNRDVLSRTLFVSITCLSGE